MSNTAQPVVSSLPAIIYAALLSGILFAGAFTVFHYNAVEVTQPIKIAITISTIFIASFMAITIYKKQAVLLNFSQGFLTGWAAALFLAILVIIYQSFFYQFIMKVEAPDKFWVPTILIHNIIGAMISAILALLNKTKETAEHA